jgi:UPF0271 protein
VEQVYVLDAGAFLSNWTQKHPTSIFITTENILDEIRNRPSKTRIDTLISVDRLRIEAADNELISEVSNAATKTGDKKSLSENDIELIALALSRQSSSSIVTLVSADFAVLNTASYLEIEILDLTGKMKHAIKWTLECPACNYRGNEGLDCPVCGTRMHRKSRKKKILK